MQPHIASGHQFGHHRTGVFEVGCVSQFSTLSIAILRMKWPVCFGAWMMPCASLRQLWECGSAILSSVI